MPSLNFFKNVGPGALVAAAFIGPGTVTVCTLAGANFGYTLLWALLFATVSTIIFQEMSGRLGTIAQKGLGEALRDSLQHSMWKWPLFALIAMALYGGNAAYEAGNLSGAALGVSAILDEPNDTMFTWTIVLITLVAALVLWRGSYKQVERLLMVLVLFMGVAFVSTFIVSQPDFGAFFHGMFTPTLPDDSLITVVALIGTTVVPYNLFLHASAAKARWQGEADLSAARADSVVSIGLGGLVAMFIVSTAAASLFSRGLGANSAADMAIQLEPLFGSFSKYLLGAGLLAAGLSSSLTAPLATAYAITEIVNPNAKMKEKIFRGISLSVLAVGMVFALSGAKPINIIIGAQFANGLLLPIIAAFLLYTMNNKALLGKYTNGIVANSLGVIVFIVSLGLGVRLVLKSLSVM
ncbi:natural resistance-associated macrophage protein [Paraglaciecola sp. T6c]|uniref:Nramp family divalent metal transporter n=1 Tax=Pseudoalteromonas atlantica (strain T6c / ATCC BAA-1087) TaxID=3042615 RepID=UPI00005C5EC9|nr:Nramp family divalent metal transporter [Paraglaciecola sp. T6c]ABG42315.1 natural resistance-associated macrophage protein [Paraglaciecola sp. T6c]